MLCTGSYFSYFLLCRSLLKAIILGALSRQRFDFPECILNLKFSNLQSLKYMYFLAKLFYSFHICLCNVCFWIIKYVQFLSIYIYVIRFTIKLKESFWHSVILKILKNFPFLTASSTHNILISLINDQYAAEILRSCDVDPKIEFFQSHENFLRVKSNLNLAASLIFSYLIIEIVLLFCRSSWI